MKGNPLSTTLQLSLILSVCLLFATAQQNECESTHLQFFSAHSLGRQDELNRTFTKMQEKITSLDDVSYLHDSTTYQITNVKPKFFYIDSNQTASLSGQYIIISGGRLQVQMTFDWNKKGSRGQGEGNGIAIAQSNNIYFAKFYKVEGGFLLEEVYAYEPVIFSERKTRLSRINPPSISDDDVDVIESLLNNLPEIRSVTTQLADSIEKIFSYYLNNSLYDQRRNIHEHFEYDWNNPNPSSKSLDIIYELNMTDSDISQGGIEGFYRMQIPNYTKWECTLPSPKLPLNPKTYGAPQQFISLDVYTNTIRYAIDQNALDTALIRQNWESRFFQFFAGDLYEVIPKLAEEFHATDVVSGECNATTEGLNVTKGGHDFLNVTIQYNCTMMIGTETIAEFDLLLISMVEGIPQRKQLDFKVTDFVHHATWKDFSSKYKIENRQLANHMVIHSLNRLKESKVFGSGWPLYIRDYPHFIVEDNYTIVYDTTIVNSENSQNIELQEYAEKLRKQIKME